MILNIHSWRHFSRTTIQYLWSSIFIREDTFDLQISSPTTRSGGTSKFSWVYTQWRLKFSRRVECRTHSICYEDSQGGSHKTHKPCFAQRRYLLNKVNAPRAFCVLIFTAHRHQYCGGYWHFCLESQTKTRWLGRLTTLRAELWPSSTIPPDLSCSGMPHETLRTRTLKTH